MSSKPNEWFTPVTLIWTGIVVAFAMLLWIFWDGVHYMTGKWHKDEYSYAFVLPFLIAFFIWQKKNELAAADLRGSWTGFAIVAAGLVLYVAGELGTLYTVIQYGFILALVGTALALLGGSGARVIAIPLMMLFFLVPLPSFLHFNLSQWLQLLSSKWGVWVIQQFGISVFLEGNVIDLGTMKLQVAEACSGLGYLFPLMVLGFIMAYVYRGPFWQRALLVLSTIPITVLMNSLRIGLTGVAVEYWGQEMAEGLLHFFEGWVVFMAATAVLVLEMWLLNLFRRPRRPLHGRFQLDFPGPMDPAVAGRPRRPPPPFLATLGLLAVAVFAVAAVPARQEVVPARQDFALFPMAFDDWQGRPAHPSSEFLEGLRSLPLDDYLIADFVAERGEHVALYMAWYDSQQKGASVHSPRGCIPGGGWEIQSLEQRVIGTANVNGQPLRVNRVLIQKGNDRQLVYYWFQQRGRVLTNEYLVKWYLLVDALTRQRTDGALIRLVTPVLAGADVEKADQQLAAFATAVEAQLEPFIPN